MYVNIAIYNHTYTDPADFNIGFSSRRLCGDLSVLLNYLLEKDCYVIHDDNMTMGYIGKMLKDGIKLSRKEQKNTVISLDDKHIAISSVVRHVKMRWPEVSINFGMDCMWGPGVSVIRETIQKEIVDWVVYDLTHKKQIA